MADNQVVLNDVKEGAELDLALKSEEGKVIVNSIVEKVSANLEAILMKQGLSADAILEKVYECRGIVSSLGGIGDKRTFTHSVIAKRVINEQIKVRA